MLQEAGLALWLRSVATAEQSLRAALPLLQVVVVDDGLDSIRSWEYIQTCEMLSKGIADVSLAAEDPPPGIETAVSDDCVSSRHTR